MESVRQQKVARLLQKELGSYFQMYASSFAPGGMITVTVVRVSPDLGLAKVYLSVFPSDKGESAVLAINEQVKSIRYGIGKIVRHQLRIVPELMFFKDDSLDYADRIDELLNE